MTKKIVVVAIIALGIILSLFLGCKDDLIETLEKVQAYVEISVKLPEEFKTVDPADPNYFDPDTFTYTLTWFPVNDPTNKTLEDFAYDENVAVVFKFDPGEYTFVLEGKVIDEDTNQEEIKARGEATTSIEPGQREQLEIPLTYYVYGGESGFTLENGIMWLTGDLTFTDDTTITVPAGMKLVIEDGYTIDVGDGNKLTINGPVEAEGNLAIVGNLEVTNEFTVVGDLSLTKDTVITIPADKTLTVGGDIDVEGYLTLSGEGKLHTKGGLSVEGDFTANTDLIVDNTLGVEGSIEINGDVQVGTLSAPEGEKELEIKIGQGGTLEATSIDEAYDKVVVSSGGALKITDDTSLDEIVLNNGSSLEIEGALNSTDELKLSGDGAVTAGSVVADKLITEGDQTITAATIEITEIELDENTTLTLNGDVTTEEISGKGSVKVEGALIVEDLTIDSNATLEASSLETIGDTVTIQGGGTLQVNSNTTLNNLEIEDGSTLEVDGTLQSNTISGEGNLVADSVTTDKLSNTGDLVVTADPIAATEIVLEGGQTLTLDGDVTTGKIAGNGSLVVIGVVGGAEGGLTIEGDPTVLGDLSLEPDTILSFDDGSTLTVEGDVKAWGDLTLIGEGTLNATNITVAGELDGGDVDVEGIVETGTLPLGKKPNLEVYIKSGESFPLENIEDGWETVTVKGGGTLIVKDDTALDAITLENGSSMEVTGDLSLSAGATLSLSSGSVLEVTGDVEALGALTLLGDGTLEAKDNLTVFGDFTTEAVVNVENALEVGGDVEIDGAVSVGSLTMDDASTLTITKDGSLEIEDDGTTTLNKVVLGDNAILEVGGTLESGTISGSGTVTAGLIDVTTVETEEEKTLTLEGNVEVSGDLTVLGDGELEITGDLTVVGVFIAHTDVTVGGVTTVDTHIQWEKPNLVVNIKKGDTLELDAIESGYETVTVKGGGTLIVKDDTALDAITLENGSSMEVTGDLSLSAGATLSLSSGSVLEVTGDVEALGALTLLGDGTLEAKDNLTVFGDFTTEAVVNVENALEVGGDVEIDGAVSVGSLTMDDASTLTITKDGSLEIEDTDTTELGDVVLASGSVLEVSGELTATTISGAGRVLAESVTTETLSNTGSLEVTVTDSIVAGEIELAEGETLSLTGDVTTGSLSGKGSVIVDGVVEGDGGELTISGTPKVTGDLKLEADTTLIFSDDAVLEVTCDVEALGALTLLGDGTLEAKDNLTVYGDLTSSSSTVILEVGGDISADVLAIGDKPHLVVTIQDGKVLEVQSIDEGYITVTVKGGGAFVIKDDTETITLEKVTFEDDSSMEITGTLKGDAGKVLTVSGDSTLTVGSLVTDLLSNENNPIITADTFEVEKIVLAEGTTLTLVGDVAPESVSGSGNLEVQGELDLGAEGWIAVDFAGGSTITLAGSESDLLINGGSKKWYTLDGAKAHYWYLNEEVTLTFIQGDGNQKATPVRVDITPTEQVTKVGAGVTFAVTQDKSKFYLIDGAELIVEDDGILDLEKWWFENLDKDNFGGSITIMSGGSLMWADKYSVGPSETTPPAQWHGWAWKQNGTMTKITYSNDDNKYKFTALPGGGLGDSAIDIRHQEVNTPIEIGEGVTATISGKLVQNSSVFTIKGTVIVVDSGEFIVEKDEGFVFGSVTADLNVKSGGTFTYKTDKWILHGVKLNGVVKIEGGSSVTLGDKYWFGPTPSSPDSQINLGSNILITITDGWLTASKKDEDIGTDNILVAKLIDNRMFGAPNVNMRIKEGVEFNVADYFVNQGNIEVEGGAIFSVGSSGHYAILGGKILTLYSGAHLKVIGTSGKIEKIINKYSGGIIDIKEGATVSINNKTAVGKKATYSSNVTDHIVKYNESQIHP